MQISFAFLCIAFVIIQVILLVTSISQKKKGKKIFPYMIIFGLLWLVLIGIIAGTIITFDKAATSVTIIGGADGPTSVFLAGKLPENHKNSKLTFKKAEKDDQGVSLLPLDVIFEAEAYQDGYLICILRNETGYPINYGEEYFLQKKEGNEWKDVDAVEDYAWDEVSYELKDLEETTLMYDLSVFGELEKGEYRLKKYGDLYAEFILK